MVVADKSSFWPGRLKIVSQLTAGIVAIGGGAVLLGWVLENELLKRVHPAFVAMNPITACGFILAGASLFCFWKSEHRRLFSVCGRVLAVFLILIGLLKLTTYFFTLDLPFDRILFGNQIRNEATALPNQIAP